MESSDVVDAIDKAPSSKINITYPNGETVEFGEELKPEDVKDEPQVSWDADPAKYYTLIVFDPDAPSRHEPKFADVKHWLVVNIQGCNVASGEVIWIFEQQGKMEFDEPKSGKLSREHRISWSMRKFAKKNNLGQVYAGNYFNAQWSPFVDEWKKQREMEADNANK